LQPVFVEECVVRIEARESENERVRGESMSVRVRE
jgi:hypothetical protein